MKKILFLCHGNICRSPMAQYVMQHKVDQCGLSDRFFIESKALSPEEIGKRIHYGTVNIFEKYHIPYRDHRACEFESADYDYYDLIVLMDRYNLQRIKRYIKGDPLHKIVMLLNRDVADPWYTGDFETTYRDIDRGTDQLLRRLSHE